MSAAAPPPREAQPAAELPIKNYKYVKNCTELYLAQRGIERLAHFDGFVNLEVLWVNDNEIQSLEGLDQCFRLKQLYAHNNRIRSLTGSSLPRFKFLTELRLYGNQLGDLAATLAVLGRLHHLEDLDLFDNPLQEEEHYRLHVIRVVPSLVVLDRHVITDDERARAQRLPPLLDDIVPPSPCGAPTPPATTRDRKAPKLVAGAPPQAMSGTVKMLFREVEAIRREAEARARETAAQELLQLSAAQRSLVHVQTSRSAGTTRSAASQVPGLDDWELAALEKHFRGLEDKKLGGLTSSARLADVLNFLVDRGLRLVLADGHGPALDPTTDDTAVSRLIAAVFPGDAARCISWRAFRQALDRSQLRCQVMAPDELGSRADDLFRRAGALQRRLLAATTSEDARGPLAREMHDLTQRAHRLQGLAERQGATETAAAPGRKTAAGASMGHTMGPTGTPPPTQFYLSTYTREDSPTAHFHELKEQSAQVRGDLSVKYKLHGKEFAKYLVQQAPPHAALVRKQFLL